jgi:hypothetical protein
MDAGTGTSTKVRCRQESLFGNTDIPRDIPSDARPKSQASGRLSFCPPASSETTKATVLKLDIARVPVSI